MKKVINVSIGKRKFTINEDAYQRLNAYLNTFRERTKMGISANEVMDELEMRIADLFEAKVHEGEVVTISLVNQVIAQLGMPDSDEDASQDNFNTTNQNYDQSKSVHKFYRDPDASAIGGVCSGLAAYFNIDLTLVRIVMLILIIFGSIGFWIYIILWIVAPKAVTATQKCELRGLPVTAENISKFSKKY